MLETAANIVVPDQCVPLSSAAVRREILLTLDLSFLFMHFLNFPSTIRGPYRSGLALLTRALVA